jgi:hypothetical protein
MSNISQSGSYRGVVIDRGLGKSSGGHLQLVLSLQATEKWNDEAEVWEPFQYEDSEAQAYLNLVTSKEKANPVNPRQIMRAFGWDGVSFDPLNDMDSGLATQIQWRMGFETYNDREQCKVQSIGTYDGTPGRKVEKLTPAEVRDINTRYAAILRELGGGPKPKTAAPKAPPKEKPAHPDQARAAEEVAKAPAGGSVRAPDTDPTPAPSPIPGGDAPTESGSTGSQEPPTNPTPAPSSAPSSAPAPSGKTTGGKKKPAVPKAPPKTPMTQEEAWAAWTVKADGKTDLEIQNTWIAVIKEVYGGDENVGDDWSPVVAECIKRLGV